MVQPKGEYRFQVIIPRHIIEEILQLPPEYVGRVARYAEDRDALVMLVDAPAQPEYFVPYGEVYPVVSPAITVMETSLGRRIDIKFPQFEEA